MRRLQSGDLPGLLDDPELLFGGYAVSLELWGMRLERQPKYDLAWWEFMPDVGLSDHGAHVYGIPFFDNHPSYAGRINWKVVDGGYIRGIE